MEDVLEVYTWPDRDDIRIVCMDEISTQLLIDTREAIPAEASQPKRQDHEYERNGTANIFIGFEPLRGFVVGVVTTGLRLSVTTESPAICGVTLNVAASVLTIDGSLFIVSTRGLATTDTLPCAARRSSSFVTSVTRSGQCSPHVSAPNAQARRRAPQYLFGFHCVFGGVLRGRTAAAVAVCVSKAGAGFEALRVTAGVTCQLTRPTEHRSSP